MPWGSTSASSVSRLSTLSGGQRRRVELSRILFSGAETLLLDEPTNHLDADSIAWLRDYLKGYQGGLVVISHDVELLDAVVNRVFHLDANRGELDLYNVGWKSYLQQRETDERRRKREYANAEKKAAALMEQADKMRAKATKAVAAQNMVAPAERLLAGVEGERAHDKVAKLRFPDPAPCGRTPLRAQRAVALLRQRWRSSPTSTWPSTAARGSSCSASTAPARPPCCGCSPGSTPPTPAQVEPGHGLKLGYYAQEHENLDVTRTVLREHEVGRTRASARPTCARCSARSCSAATTSTSRPACCPAARRPGCRWRCSSCRRPTCCSSTSPPTTSTRPRARRSSGALRTYEGAVVLVTHDEGAVDALEPERILLLPDGVEDLWSADYRDLISLA